MRLIPESFVVLLLLSAPWTLLGQGPTYQCQEDQNTLIRDEYTVISQNQNGLLWLGAMEGVWAFDGAQLHPKLSSNDSVFQACSALFTDRQDRVWAGFANGAIARTDKLGSMSSWLPEEGWPQARITAFAEDAEGRIWIGTYGEGIYCFASQRLYQFGREDGMESSDIYTLTSDSAGNIWAGTDAGVHLLAWKDQQKHISVFDSDDGLADNIVTCILPRSNGELWLGTYENGIVKATFKDGTLYFEDLGSWSAGSISSISEMDDRKLWVGTNNKGVYIYDIGTKTWVSETASRKLPQRISSLFCDQEGLLWILSKDHGLCRIQARLAIWDNLPVSPQAVAIDQQNKLWVGTATGLNKYSPQQPQLEEIDLGRELNIISLFCDRLNRIWIGTFGEGLFIYSVSENRLQAIGNNAGLTNGSILAISGRRDSIWLATLGGVFRSTVSEDIPVDRIIFDQPVSSEQLGTDFLYTVYPDRRAQVWFGTDGHGISCLKPDGNLINFKYASDSTIIRSVYGITEDGDGRIWISADEQNIFFIDEGQIHTPPFKMTFNPSEIPNLSTDGQGNIAIAHRRGLAIFDVQTEELIDYHHLSESFTFQPVLNADGLTHSGNLWLAGTQELLAYDAYQNSYRQQPKVSITKVTVNLEPVDLNQQTTLGAAENNLVFYYAGVWLNDPEEVLFQYRLNGFDSNWISTKDQQAVYSNLPPGEYTFEVRATQNNRFGPGSTTASTHFLIDRPIYLQAWFLTASILLLIFLLRHLLQRREQQLQKEALLLKDKVESQYETLKSQINPHFLFNSFNTLVTLIEEKPNSAVTYVEKLADFYRSILQYREQDTVSIQEEIRIVKDYHFILRQRYDENLQLEISELPQEAFLPPLVLQMLVENAVKHNVISSSRPLWIKIYQDGPYIVVENKIQAKINTLPSTGFGLENIKNRYQLVSTLEVKVEQASDLFKVAVPFLDKSLNIHSP